MTSLQSFSRRPSQPFQIYVMAQVNSYGYPSCKVVQNLEFLAGYIWCPEQIWDTLSTEQVEWVRTYHCLLLPLLHILGSAEPTTGIERVFLYPKNVTMSKLYKGLKHAIPDLETWMIGIKRQRRITWERDL